MPLVLAGPGFPRGRTVSELVRTIDLPATLLDYLGLPAGFGSGASLRPLLDGKEKTPRTAYAESLYGFHHLGFSPLYALESSDYRFIDAPRKELYQVTSDPGERVDLLLERRAVSRDLFEQLSDLRSSLGSGADSRVEIDAETKEKLQSLGYLPSAASSRKQDTNLPDPKDEMDAYHRIQEAQLLKSQKKCKDVLEALEPVRRRKNPIPLVYELTTACHLDLSQWEMAASAAREALFLGFETPRFHVDLGVAALRQGKAQEAEREIRLALALDEKSVIAHYHLGDALRAQKRDAEAIASYRESLEINSRYVYAWNGLGMCLARAGKNQDALEAFRRVVELEGDQPRGYFNLAVQLERMSRRDEALALYRRFLEMSTEAEFRRERARAREALGLSPSK